MSLFEAGMLVCFGVSWPVSILKTLRTRVVQGKSPLFMVLVFVGYASGIAHKVLYARDWVLALYVFNLAMVFTDLALYWRYRPRAVAAP
jgi:hypothetical protein